MSREDALEAEWQAETDRLVEAAVSLLVKCAEIRSVGAEEVELLRELVAGLEHVTGLLRDLHELPAETWAMLAALEAQLRQ